MLLMVLNFVFTDSFLSKGQFLLHLISANRKSYDIHVLCYENLVSKHQTLFPSLSNIQYHNCMFNIMSLNLSLFETVSCIVEKSTRKVVILIDSLSMYLLFTDFRKVYKELLDITSSDKCNLIYYLLLLMSIMIYDLVTGVYLIFAII